MNETIFLLETAISQKEITDLIKNNENLRIFSLDYESHQFLENLEIDHTIGDTLLTNDVLQNIDNITIDITKNWYKNELLKTYKIGFDSFGFENYVVEDFKVSYQGSATKGILKIIFVDKELPDLRVKNVNGDWVLAER